MAKTKVKHTGSVPLYLNLPGGKCMKIQKGSIVEVDEEDLQSSPMVYHQNRGNIVVLTQTKSSRTASSKPKTGNTNKDLGKRYGSEQPCAPECPAN